LKDLSFHFLKCLQSANKERETVFFFFRSMPDSAGKRSITRQDINAAVKETIAWAKEHVAAIN